MFHPKLIYTKRVSLKDNILFYLLCLQEKAQRKAEKAKRKKSSAPSERSSKPKKKSKLPGQPKKPMTAYFMWMNEEGR